MKNLRNIWWTHEIHKAFIFERRCKGPHRVVSSDVTIVFNFVENEMQTITDVRVIFPY